MDFANPGLALVVTVAMGLLAVGAQLGSGFTVNRGAMACWSGALALLRWYFLGSAVGIPVIVISLLVIGFLDNIPYLGSFRYVVRFSPTRDTSPSLTQILNDKRADSIWIMTHEGTNLRGENRYKISNSAGKRKIQRLILLASRGNALEAFARTSRDRNREQIIAEITQTSSVLNEQAPDLPIRYLDSPFNATIIANPEHGEYGWIQIEIFYPWSESEKRSRVRISKRSQPERFKEIVNAYEKVWKDIATENPGIAESMPGTLPPAHAAVPNMDILLHVVPANDRITYFDVTVRNNDADGKFSGQCSIVDRQPASKATRLNFPFPTYWLHDQTVRECMLRRNETGTIRIGYAINNGGRTIVDFTEASNGGLSNFSRENVAGQNPFEWDLNIEIFKTGAGSKIERFRLVRQPDGSFSSARWNG